MTFRLQDVRDWHPSVACVPTALCAISGRTLENAMAALAAAAKSRDSPVSVSPSAAFNINDWLAVVNSFGGRWAAIEDYSSRPYGQRITISEYLRRPTSSELRLVFGENSSATITHVFALGDGKLVDTYTGGKVVSADSAAVPTSYNDFRVKRIFQVVCP